MTAASGPDIGSRVPGSDSTTVVLVTGAGRSGTSTISGSLKYLGIHVPQPEVAATASNPRGHFEPRWLVDMHKRVLHRAGVSHLDPSPLVAERVAAVLADPAVREEMTTWAGEVLAQSGQVVLKDPRTVWAVPAWHDILTELGARPVYLSMIRRPTEVVGSYHAAYHREDGKGDARATQIRNTAGWVHINLTNEYLTRGRERIFLSYEALLSDWRSALGRVADVLDLQLDADLADAAHHEIDEFIDPGLRRTRASWDDIDVPVELRELAEETWGCLSTLAGPARADRDLEQAADGLRDRYTRMIGDARALVSGEIALAGARGRQEGRDEQSLTAKRDQALAHAEGIEEGRRRQRRVLKEKQQRRRVAAAARAARRPRLVRLIVAVRSRMRARSGVGGR